MHMCHLKASSAWSAVTRGLCADLHEFRSSSRLLEVLALEVDNLGVF